MVSLANRRVKKNRFRIHEITRMNKHRDMTSYIANHIFKYIRNLARKSRNFGANNDRICVRKITNPKIRRKGRTYRRERWQ